MMDILQYVGSTALVIAGAIGGWFLNEFWRNPIRKFYELRTEAIEKLTRYDSAPATRKADHEGLIVETYELSELQLRHLSEAQVAFGDLAARMRAFAQGEPWAQFVVKRLGYDPLEISRVLSGVANTIGTYGNDRRHYKERLARELGIDWPG